MGESLDDALHDLLGAIVIPAHSVAQVDDSSPVFGREVLVGRLAYKSETTVRSLLSQRQKVAGQDGGCVRRTDGLVVGARSRCSEHGW